MGFSYYPNTRDLKPPEPSHSQVNSELFSFCLKSLGFSYFWKGWQKWLHVCCWFWERVSLCNPVYPELATQSRLASNSWSSCFSLQSTEIRGWCHHTWGDSIFILTISLLISRQFSLMTSLINHFVTWLYWPLIGMSSGWYDLIEVGVGVTSSWGSAPMKPFWLNLSN
jgi:hypothetical protein